MKISIYLFIGYSDVFYTMNYLSRLLSPHSSRIFLFLINLQEDFAFIDTLPGIYVAIFFFQMCYLS